MTDALLAVRCQLGDAEAFDELVERFHPALFRYIRRLTGSDDAASDTVQDVWLRVVRGLPRLREPERLRAWIFGIAHRALMDRLRQRYARPEDTGVDVSGVPAEDQELLPEDDSELLRRALDRVPVVEREALTLFYLQELTLNEIADALGVPVGTVKSRLFRARGLLRNEMAKEPQS